jgi:hypothetical protein
LRDTLFSGFSSKVCAPWKGSLSEFFLSIGRIPLFAYFEIFTRQGSREIPPEAHAPVIERMPCYRMSSTFFIPFSVVHRAHYAEIQHQSRQLNARELVVQESPWQMYPQTGEVYDRLFLFWAQAIGELLEFAQRYSQSL